MCYQPMDVGSSFKVIRYETRHCTTKGTDCPLRKSLEIGFSGLKSKKFLVLPPRKLGAIIDCAATAPQVKAKAYSKQLIQKTFVDSGFTSGVDGAPNVHAVLRASNVPFATNPSLKKLFFDSLLGCTSEMYVNGSISEVFFDSLGFPVDRDCEGNIWELTSTSLVFARSQPIITCGRLQRRTAEVVKDLEEARNTRARKLQKACNHQGCRTMLRTPI